VNSSNVESKDNGNKRTFRPYLAKKLNPTGQGSQSDLFSTPMEPDLARKKPYLPTDWPIAAGRSADINVPAEIFRSDFYLDTFSPGAKREIYVAASSGLGRLSPLLAMPLYKVSTCAEGRLIERMNELRADRYGSAWFSDGRHMQDSDFDDWFPSHFQTGETAAHSPVTTAPRHLTVTLPHDMAPDQFDIEFDAAIREAAIDRWVMTKEGHDHCVFRGVEPSIAIRMTPYRYGASAKNSPARELCCFRPNKDGVRLVAIAELIILRHLGILRRPANQSR